MRAQLQRILVAATLIGGAVTLAAGGIGAAEPATPDEMRRRAEAGDAEAAFALGLAFEHGRGVARDLAAAAAWYRRAAEAGEARAQNNLGWLYQTGAGVARDYRAAAAWYRRAAAQDQRDALGNLGLLYDQGLGVPRDRPRALALLRRAASLGDREAAALADRLAAAAPVAPEPVGVFGSWQSTAPIADIGVRTMWLRLTVSEHLVEFGFDCRLGDGSHLTSRFSTRARVSDTAIEVLEAGRAEADDGDNRCVASIRPTTLRYRLSDDDGLDVSFHNRRVAMVRTAN